MTNVVIEKNKPKKVIPTGGVALFNIVYTSTLAYMSQYPPNGVYYNCRR